MFGLALAKKETSAPVAAKKTQSLPEILSLICSGLSQPQLTVAHQVEIIQKLSSFIEANQFTRSQIIEGLSEATSNGSDWIHYFEKFERSRVGFQVLPSAISLPPVEGVNEEYQLSTTIIKDVAIAPTAILICGPSGAGKSTLQRALMAETIRHYPDVEFGGVDLQANRYFGLQRTHDRKKLPVLARLDDGSQQVVDHEPNTFTFITNGVEDHMLLATEAVKKVWKVYCDRNEQKQAAVSNGLPSPSFPLYRFFFNEWNTFVEWAGKYGKSEEKAFVADAKSRGIAKPMKPSEVLNAVRCMFASGRDLSVSFCILTQDFVKEAIAMSPQCLSNGTVLAVGRVNLSEKTGGYDTVLALAKDQYRIRSAKNRALFAVEVDKAMKENRAILISTQLYGSAGVLDDFSRFEGQKFGMRYKHSVV